MADGGASLTSGARITARAESDDVLLVVSPVVTSTIPSTHSGGDDDDDEMMETPPPYAAKGGGGSGGDDDDALLQVRDAVEINMGAMSLTSAAQRAPSDPFFAEPGQAQVSTAKQPSIMPHLSRSLSLSPSLPPSLPPSLAPSLQREVHCFGFELRGRMGALRCLLYSTSSFHR